MTREEAIKIIKECKEKGFKHTFYTLNQYHDALDMAIKALEDIPKYKDVYGKGWQDGAKASYEHLKMCAEENGGDLISRDELLKAIDTWDRFGVDDTNSLFRLDNLSLPHYVPYIHYDDVIKCIKGMPPVNPQEPEWIPVSKRMPDIHNLTNGDALKTLFPYHSLIFNYDEEYILFVIENSMCCKFTLNWWNAPYKAESEEV